MKNQQGSAHLSHLPPNPQKLIYELREIRGSGGTNREKRILKVTVTKLLLLEKFKLKIKFSYRKIKEVLFPACLSF